MEKIPAEKMAKLKLMMLKLPDFQLQELKAYMNGLTTVSGRNKAIRAANARRKES